MREAWLLAGLLVLVAYDLTSLDWAQAVLYDGLGIGAAAAMTCRAVAAPRGARGPSGLAAAALGLWALADVVSDAYVLGGHELPFPSLADPLYLSGYPFLVVATALIVRQRVGRRPAASLLDSAMVTLVLAVGAWAVTGGRFGAAETHQLLQRIVLVAYPAMDVLVLGVAVRAFSTRIGRSPTLRFLMLAVAVQLCVDAVYAATVLKYEIGTPLDNGWMLAYVLFGAAALTRERLVVPAPRPDDVGIGRRRVLLVASAGLASPLALVVGSVTRGMEAELAALGAAATGLAVLGVVRLEQMFRRIGDLHATAERARLRAEATEAALAAKHERLLESEERFRHIFENAGFGIVLSNESRQPIAANPELLRISRYSAEEFRALGVEQLTHPDDLDLDADLFDEMLAGRRDSYVVEKRYLRKGGEVMWGRLAYSVSRGPDGGARFAIGMIEDITAARQAEVALLESQERWRMLVESLDELVMVLDEHGRLAYVNPSVERGLGHARDDLHESSLLDLVHPDDRATVLDSLVGEPRGGLATFRARHADGSWRTLEARGADRLDDALVCGVLVTARDVSERVALERERERLELERRLTQRLEAVGQLAAGMAHEINTPMQFVENSVSFVRTAVADVWELIDRYRELLSGDEALPWDQRRRLMEEAEEEADLEYMRRRVPEAFDRVVEGVGRVTTIVRAMRSFAHPPTTEMAPACLNDAISVTLTVCRNEYKYVADVELDLGELPPVLCNIGDLNQVFLNLVVNAAHAIQDVVGDSEERGTITIRTRVEGDRVTLEVADTGTGIPDGVRERIFEPFFTTKEVGRGTGQGLAIVRAIVDRHAGRIALVDSGAQRGTTFRVELPLRATGQLAA